MRWIVLCVCAFLYAVSIQAQTTLDVTIDASDTTLLYSAQKFIRSEEYLDLYGNVEMKVGRMRLTADHVRISTDYRNLSADGTVMLILDEQSMTVRNLEWKKSESDKATITFD